MSQISIRNLEEQQTALPSRLAGLDIARGLAALSVVLWHWQHFFQHGTPDFERHKLPLYAWLRVFYETSAHYAVTFFFVLSGFVFFWLYSREIASGECSLKKFSVYRLARLYPLHAVTLVLVLILQAAFLAQQGRYFVYGNNDAYHFVLHALFLSHWGFERGHSFNAPVWSVSLEIGLYACFFALAFIRGARWPVLVVLVATLICVQWAGIGGRWPRALEAFFLGGGAYYFVRAYLRWGGRTAMLDFLIIAIGPALWLAMAWSGEFASAILHREPWQLYARLLFPVSIISLVVFESKVRPDLSRLRWVGDISYSTYLIHFPLQILFMLVFSWLGFTAAVFYSPWMLLAFFAVLLLLALASFHWLERPLQKSIRKRWAS